jgi:hypothetical protein
VKKSVAAAACQLIRLNIWRNSIYSASASTEKRISFGSYLKAG